MLYSSGNGVVLKEELYSALDCESEISTNSDENVNKHLKNTSSKDEFERAPAEHFYPFKEHWTLKPLRRNISASLANPKSIMARNFSTPSNSIPNYDLKTNTSKNYTIDFWKSFDNGEMHNLPTLGPGRSDSIHRISIDTVKGVLEGVYNIDYVILDCRFPYEYQGGHIQKALNVNNTQEIDKLFLEYKDTCLILHCEYSSIRAPRLAKYLRNKDRSSNVYPRLQFPEIYIMEGGYKEFFKRHSSFCEPVRYITMDNKKYKKRFLKENMERNKAKKFNPQ